MGDHGDAAPETDRAKRKREAKVAFAQREEHDALDLRLRKVLLIPETQRSADQTSLLRAHATCVVSIVSSLEHRKARKATHTTRTEEREESKDSIAKKTAKLAELIRASRARGGFVLHTGAGFSTAAGVPDFRGQHGVWTMRAKGMHVPMPRFERCAPTNAHLACVALHANKFLKHVVTQNVDGLHQRAGLCDSLVSELHGSVFRETCDNSECEVTEIKRTFDVTSGKPHNGRHRHKTGRACDSCGSDLKDVVVHFGERLRDDVLKKARQVCLESTLSVVMGTSLKIPPANTLPRLSERRVICNLQWTAHDKTAAMKINAKCDDVMLAVCKHLDVQVPVYDPGKDAVAREVKEVKEQSSTKAEFAPLSKKQRSAKNPSMPRTTA